MSLTQFLLIPELAERYKKAKKYFRLRESAYDVTSLCQLRCEGCYFFKNGKDQVAETKSPRDWERFLISERDRGINFVNLAGAEPSLVPEVLRTCFRVIPSGTVFTNGLKRIPEDIDYRVHISVWGGKDGDPKYRKYASGRIGPFCLPIQLANYKRDSRPIFVFTFNEENSSQADEVIRAVAGEGHKITFNVFSPPVEGKSPLEVRDQLTRVRATMIESMIKYPDAVVYSYYNAEVHTQLTSLWNQFGCPYPRAAGPNMSVGIGATFRSYRTDFTHLRASDCCVPDTDCAQCRHYAAGSAIVTARLDKHVASEALFRGWLDYIDTYLAIWVRGYERGPNLYSNTN